MSFRQITKNRGPATDPCGTPDVTLAHSDGCPSSTTRWNLLVRKDSIQVNSILEIPKHCSLSSSRRCRTESMPTKSRQIWHDWALLSSRIWLIHVLRLTAVFDSCRSVQYGIHVGSHEVDVSLRKCVIFLWMMRSRILITVLVKLTGCMV